MNKYEMIEEIAVGEITIGKAKQIYELLDKHFREATLEEVKEAVTTCDGYVSREVIKAIDKLRGK